MTRPFSPYAGTRQRISRGIAWAALGLQALLVALVLFLPVYGYLRIAHGDANYNGTGVFEPALALTGLVVVLAVLRCIAARKWLPSALGLGVLALLGLGATYPLFRCNLLVSYEVFTARHLAGPDPDCCAWLSFAKACQAATP